MRTHGTIRKWNDARGFGFIDAATGGDEVFVHISAFPRGIRPVVGDTVSFEIAVDGSGRRRATAIQVPHARPVRSVRPRERAQRSGSMSVVFAAALAGIGMAAYLYFRSPIESTPLRTEEISGVAHSPVESTPRAASQPAPTSFACDGRQHCSQMTSCAEARYFLAHCPGTKMDGDHDGEPCESQWCGGSQW